MSMTLTDGTNTFTSSTEDVKCTPISNSSMTVTRGGKVINQVDSQRLQIESTVRVSKTDLQTLNSILTNYTASLTYTPSRILLYKTSIESLSVVLTNAFEVNDETWNGEVFTIIKMKFDEVVDNS